jgi:hypothetical protein
MFDPAVKLPYELAPAPADCGSGTKEEVPPNNGSWDGETAINDPNSVSESMRVLRGGLVGFDSDDAAFGCLNIELSEGIESKSGE